MWIIVNKVFKSLGFFAMIINKTNSVLKINLVLFLTKEFVINECNDCLHAYKAPLQIS